MSQARAAALVIGAVVIAAALGLVLRGDDSNSSPERPRTLSRADVPPALPAYEPGGGWPQLPAEPPPEVVEEPEDFVSEEEAAPEEYVPVYEPEPVEPVESSGGGGSPDRPHGITISP